MTKITKIIWNEWNSKHIRKHNVTKEEVEEAIQRVNAHKKGYSKRIMLLGRSGKRILSIVIAQEENNYYYPITARDADKAERKMLYENEKK